MTRHEIVLAMPSGGRRCDESTELVATFSRQHSVGWFPSSRSGPNFNICFAQGLAEAQAGRASYLAMVHDDVGVVAGLSAAVRAGDILIAELERTGADFISAAIAIKDHRGLWSCGIGDPNDRWYQWRRFTVAEAKKLPQTFSAADVGYGDKYLMHNMGLCMWDLRSPVWHQKDENGKYFFSFNFVEEIWDKPGSTLEVRQGGEDCNFSTLMWKYGAKSVITQKMVTRHMEGKMPFDSHGNWGVWQNGDEEMAHKWRAADPLKEVRLEELIGSPD